MSFFKSLGSSGSIVWVLGAALLLGALLLIPRRTRRLARAWLLFVTGAYTVFGMPVVATALAGGLPAVGRLHRDDDPIGTLVVLDGDNRRGRLKVTLDMLRAHRAAALWLLSDEWLPDEIVAAGHPRGSFRHEASHQNTREQMAWVERFLGVHPDARVTLIASRLQAPRVAALAERRNLPLTILPSPIDDEPPVSGWRKWVPTYIGLRTSRDALYEHAALWHYRRQGWID